MELLADLLQVLLPAGLVLYAVYLTLNAFLKNQRTDRQDEERTRTVLPIRLQAYERMCLFLERISPNQLLLRTSGRAEHVLEYQQVLLSEIREEFAHNLAQQLYLSDEAWERIRLTQNEIAALINQAATGLDPTAPPIELARRLGESLYDRPDPTAATLAFVKAEARAQFMP
jgi:hypothetical protein